MTDAPDMINSPPHYQGAGGLEAIGVIEAYGLGYHLGNAVKYLVRAGRKGPAKPDLEKAGWYLARPYRHQRGDDVAASGCVRAALEPGEVVQAFGLSGDQAVALLMILKSVRCTAPRAGRPLLLAARAAVARAIERCEAAP